MNPLFGSATLLLLFLLSPTTTSAAGTAVFDTNHRPLQANTDYRIVPMEGGGGLNLLPLFDTGQIIGRQMVLGNTGEIGNPGGPTRFNWFKIEKAQSLNDAYKLVFCPSVCSDHCGVTCGELGVFVVDDGRRFLSFSENPILVRFERA